MWWMEAGKYSLPTGESLPNMGIKKLQYAPPYKLGAPPLPLVFLSKRKRGKDSEKHRSTEIGPIHRRSR